MGFTYDYYLTETQYEDTVTPTRSNLLMRTLVLTEEDALAYGQYLTPLPTAELNDLTYTRYTQDCADRRASACTAFEMNSAGFHAEATLDRANLMFFSVPYDDGFTAYVNGEKADILRVDEGLMAVIADTVLEQGGEVTGIEAQMFADQGVAHQGLTELVIVPDITERRTRMIELGDVFIAFPGGTGTLEEVSEVVSKICLNQLSQPCIFYNLNGFYDDMKAFLQRMINVGFSTSERQHGIYFASNLTEIEHIIATHQA